mmetsp:Transcript_15081/g.28833  ORF Transcript_15081/g.28833 Transcript_15081/m.28833 type:complete len:175 (-) Transcript_15081:1025-1549(-)
MTYRSRGRSRNEAIAAIVFAGFLAGFILYLCVGNYQRAKRAMERQRKRRLELEEEKRALALSPNCGENIGTIDRRRRNNVGCGAHDSPRSNYSGTSSMYTDEKGLAVGVGRVEVVGDRSHVIVGGGHGPHGRGFMIPHQRNANVSPRDLLDDDRVPESYTNSMKKTNSEGEMSV